MKKILVRVAFTLLLTTGCAKAAVLSLLPSSQEVQPGDNLSLDLQVSNLGNGTAPSLAGFELAILFDDSMLSFSGVQFGDLLGDVALGEAQIIEDGLVSAGVLRLSEVSYLEENAATCVFCLPPYLEDLQTDQFVLATIGFDALAVGDSALSLDSVILSDGSGVPIPVTGVGNGQVRVVAPGSVPAPAPILTIPLLFTLLLRRRFAGR